MAKNITVTITQEEFDLLEENFGAGATRQWLGNLLSHKIKRRVDQTVLDLTAYNPNKLKSIQDKFSKLSGITLPTREERDGVV